jgi:hypothetical protein
MNLKLLEMESLIILPPTKTENTSNFIYQVIKNERKQRGTYTPCSLDTTVGKRFSIFCKIQLGLFI